MRAVRTSFFLLLLFSAIILASGCGYGWQGRSNPWKKEGVERVYIPSMRNLSLRSGTENMFVSALVREFSRSNRLKVVDSEQNADAVLRGRLVAVENSGQGDVPLSNITRDERSRGIENVVVFSEYRSSATVEFTLIRKRDGEALWTQSFSGSKLYPANNRFGLEGTTSALINSSQEQLALDEIAKTIASDVQDTMLEAF